MATKKRIDVVLTDEELDFLKILADRDDKTLQEVMRDLFYLQLREERDYYEESGY